MTVSFEGYRRLISYAVISRALKYASKQFSARAKYYLEHIFSRCSDAEQRLQKTLRRTTMTDEANLEAQANGPTRRQAILGVATAIGGLALDSTQARAAAEEEVSHSAESIHQEPVFKASRKRVYEALTDAKQFDKIIQLSAAMKTMSLKGGGSQISNEAGGAFSLFGGYVTGRQIELV